MLVLLLAGAALLPPPTAILNLDTVRTVGLAPGSSVIPIIPSAAPFVTMGSAGRPAPLPVTSGHTWVYPGLYNLAPGSLGSVQLSDAGSRGSFRTSVNLSEVAPARTGVIGYPEIQYGAKPWCTAAPCSAPPTAAALPLPLPVSSVPPITASVAYSTTAPVGPQRTPFDIAFDLWLTAHPHQTSAGPGDVEAMVWLYYNDPIILPGSHIVGRTTTADPVGTSGSQQWAIYVQHGDRSDGSGHWTVVYLVPEHPSPTGILRVDLKVLLGAVESVLTAAYPSSWCSGGGLTTEDPAALYLEDIELGSEFLPTGGAAGGAAQYAWELSEYSLTVSDSPGTGGPQSVGSEGSVPPV